MTTSSSKLLALIGVIALTGAGCGGTNPPVARPNPSTPSVDSQYSDPESAEEPVNLNATLDGAAWKGRVTYQGALFYTKGISFLKIDKPYLQLAFKADKAPDSRQLTISIKGFQPRTGKYTGEMEVLLSGSPTGGSDDTAMQGYQEDVPAQKTDFTFEITKWEPKGEGQAIMSAKFSGNLKGIFGSKDAKFTDGVITDLVVTVHNSN